MKEIVEEVLNWEGGLLGVYRSIDTSNLIRRFTKIGINALYIANSHCTLVNCVTGHRNHNVGTTRNISLLDLGFGEQFFDALKIFVLRYANPDATIHVYFLGFNRRPNTPDFAIKKTLPKVFQLPECTLPPNTGLCIPVAVNHSLKTEFLMKV